MTTLNTENLRVVIEDILDSRQRMDSELHTEHHEWIRARIDAEKSRKCMCDEITKTVLQWSILGILGAMVYFFQHGTLPK